MENYSKSVKREIRSLISKVYERELNLELKSLDQYFEQWRKGDLSPFDLSNEIHEFHQNTARKLYSKYQSRVLFPIYVAQGVVRGLLKEDEISNQTLDALRPKIEMIKRNWEI